MIISTHSHANVSLNSNYFYNSYTIETLFNEQINSGIDVGIVTLNPKLSFTLCPNDCLNDCENNSNKDSTLCLINCEKSNKHRTKIIKIENNKLGVFCTTCGKILYSGKDYLHYLNIDLIKEIEKYKPNLNALLNLSICDNTIQNEINFFENYYNNLFVGYKLHPWCDQKSVENLKIHSNLPILIHTGMRKIENSMNAICFSKNYNGNVIISHAAQLSKKALTIIANQDNLYLDLCPAQMLFDFKEHTLIEHQHIYSPIDIYKYIFDLVPSNKILFGTDAPWGNMKQEVNLLKNFIYKYNLSTKDINNILYLNALNLFKLNI